MKSSYISGYINKTGLSLCFFLFLSFSLFPQTYNFRNFNTEDGLTQSYVYSITEDLHGYLWVGTDNGLFRYNGFKFENFLASDSVTNNFISCSINDGDCVWFGHRNGRISVFDGKKLFTINKTQTQLSAITQFAKSPDNKIWASTYSGGLFKLVKDSGVTKRYLFKEQINILSFEFLDNNTLLIGTNNGLFNCRLKGSGEIEILMRMSEIPESKISSVRKGISGTIFYVATENDGIFRLVREGNRINVKKIILDHDSGISGVEKIYEDSHFNLWICSRNDGLIKLSNTGDGDKPKTSSSYKTSKLSGTNANTVYEDRQGNIWVGNYGQGLTLITPKTFSVNKFDNPLYGNNIFSICLSQNSGWAGTENGLVKFDLSTGKPVKFYSIKEGLPKDTVTAIYSNNGGDLWIGTENNGIYMMKTVNKKILKYPIGIGILENSINDISGKGDHVWVGTKKGLCNINLDNNKVKWYTINQGGLPHNFINCLYFDRSGKLWVSSRCRTLAYIEDEKVVKIPVNSGTRILTLGPITEDNDSRIWVGSYGNGVFMIESDSIVNLTVKEGLISNYCYSMICDDQKNIWIGHKGGVSRIRTTDYSVKPIKHIESLTDSYQFNTNSISNELHGKIWFGSQKGLVSFCPSMDSSVLKPPVLEIISIKINDVEKVYSGKLILPPGNYKMRIDFLGISLKEPELVTYQYKLAGYDQWSEITKNTFVTYNHLTEGNYTFFLKASSGEGVVTETPVTISIVINQSLWEKWWFYLGIVFLLFSLTVIFIKRREYRFLAEKSILEEKVRERTHEIQCQKNELEIQRDLIDEKNVSITSSIRYASKIQNAVLPPNELFDKLLPDYFILSRPKDIVSGDFYWLAERDNKIVFTVADCTGHGVPGAFMSVLGITLLNEIVNIKGITKSDIIVKKLRERVIDTLQQNRKAAVTLDGMDIALCVLDKQQNTLQYTGGMNDLVFIRDGKLEIIKADRFSVCCLFATSNDFAIREIDCRKGDIIYLFSDGYQDQFGGDFDKKFLKQHFYLTLLEIHKLPMSNQKKILENKQDEWIRDGIQTDDITVIGIRL